IANLLVVVGNSYAAALPARFLTGVFLAAVYPPSLKAMSSWYRTGRGFALGVMIGALTLGSALPHLINALGGLDWTITLTAASVLTILGGLIAEFVADDGPHVTRASVFDPTQLRAIARNPRFALASAGYFGHMWELYAMWAWIAAFYGDVFTDRVTDQDNAARLASLAAFAVIGIGAIGSAYAGVLSDRTSRVDAAAIALRWSAALCMVVGFLVDAPLPIVVGAGLVWGFWVVADSAQFSTIVTEVTDPDYIGTALTVQLAAGFTLTVFTIFLVPIVRDATSWGWAFVLLAPGPALGGWAMRKLRSLPAIEPEPEREQAAMFSPFF
ncbi:MAG: MFS transporter, partial [Actinomycetota bacterium]